MDKTLKLLKEYRNITHFYADKDAGACLSMRWSTDGKSREIRQFIAEVDEHIEHQEKKQKPDALK